MAALEVVVRFPGCEQGVQAHDLGALDVAEALQAFQHVVQAFGSHGLAGRARHGAAAGDEQMRVLRHDAMGLVQLQRFVEALAQLGKVLQRAAQERDVAADGPAARQAGDGLRDHRLEDGRGDVLLARAFVEQRLDVGLREHAAAAGDGIDGGGALGQFVQAAGIGIQKRRHLVDECARAASARAVHALLDALVEVDDLGVLAAQLDGHVGSGDERLHGRLAGDDLLHELHAEPLRQKQAARSGDGDGHGLAAESAACGVLGLRRFGEHLHDGGAHVGMVAAVHGELDVAVLVEDGQLHRGGTHVDADVQRSRTHARRLPVFASHGFVCHDVLLRGHVLFSHPVHSFIDSPGLMKNSRMAMSAISSELSCMPVSIHRWMMPRYADAKNAT